MKKGFIFCETNPFHNFYTKVNTIYINCGFIEFFKLIGDEEEMAHQYPLLPLPHILSALRFLDADDGSDNDATAL